MKSILLDRSEKPLERYANYRILTKANDD